MRPFKKLEVWEKAHQLALSVYRATVNLPREERYGLTGQLRRGAVSIPANIAEGCGRNSDRDLARFLDMAAGSASEVEYHLQLARDLGLLGASAHRDLERRTTETRRMLARLIHKLRTES